MQDWIIGIEALSVGEMIFYGMLLISAIVMIIYYMTAEKPAKTALKGMLSGVAALLAVYFFGGKIGLAIPLNGFTSFISVTLGIPGVILMCIIEMLVK